MVLRISELAGRAGVPASTLRYYDRLGLMPCQRTAAGYRVYTDQAVDRLAFITAAKRVGLSLQVIAELVQVWQAGACSQVRAALRPRLRTEISAAANRLLQAQQSLNVVRRAAAHLEQLPDRSARCDPGCTLLMNEVQPESSSSAVAPDLRPEEARTLTAALVACSLGDPGQVRARAHQWRVLLEGAPCEPIDGGWQWLVGTKQAAELVELAVAEKQCCPFLDISLQMNDEGIDFRVRAPAEAGRFLVEAFPVF